MCSLGIIGTIYQHICIDFLPLLPIGHTYYVIMVYHMSMISDGSLIISKDRFACSRVDLFVLDFG